MARFNLSRNDMADPLKLHAAIEHSAQGYDFDSGWVLLTGSRVVKIKNIRTLPRFVRVFSSDNKAGTGFGNESFTDCTPNQLTVSGAKQYARVLANA